MGSRQKELISIIVPVYNVEQYLHRCLDSILHQTYDNLEIILVDDGSQDNSGAICDQYKQKDPRVQVIHQKNSGLSAARNEGLRRSHGDYIGFVDSDDWIAIDMYQRLFEVLTAHSADMAICQMTHVDADGTMRNLNPMDDSIVLLDTKEAIRQLVMDKEITSHAWRKLYKRSILGINPFPVGRYYEDVFAMPEIFHRCKTVVCLKSPLYYYYQRDDSIIKTFSVNTLQDFSDAVAYLNHFILEHYPELCHEAAVSFLHNRVMLYRCATITKNPALSFLKKQLRQDIRPYSFKFIFHLPLRKLPAAFMVKYMPYFYPLYLYAVQVLKNCTFAKKLYWQIRCFHSVPNLKAIPYPTYKTSRKFILAGSAETKNLGDVAISAATIEYLKQHFPDIPCLEIPENHILFHFSKIKKYIGKQDILLLQGGGNLGSLYKEPRKARNKVIRAFRKTNSILLMPQSVYYTEDKRGEKIKKSDQKLFSSCRDLTLYARERVSYERMKRLYSVPVEIVPDIVLSMVKGEPQTRADIGVCLRDDIESAFTIEERHQIQYKVQERYGQVKRIRTCIGNAVSIPEREKALQEKLNEFFKLKLMVTDRLHGVIFSAITNTPCVILKNNNGKLQGIHEWFSGIPYIKICENANQLESILAELETVREYPPIELHNQYKPLLNNLKSLLNQDEVLV